MKHANNFRTRIAVLISAATMLLLIAVPVLGNAQNATPVKNEQQLVQEGEEIFNNVCIACHQPDGKGIGGIYPALNGNPLITQDDPTYFISTVLTGRGGMPRFANTYNDEEIAAITTFVRQNWENDAPAVSPEQVAEVRDNVISGNELPGQRPSVTHGEEAATPSIGGSDMMKSTPVATP